MRLRQYQRLFLTALFAAAFSTSAFADLWYEHYAKGEEALKAQNWKQAVDQFNQAIEKKGEPGVGVRTYGMNFVNYHPYLRLGIAYYNLGQYDAALAAFTREETAGAIAKSPTDQKNLQTFQRLAQEAKQAGGAASEERRIAAAVKKSLEDAAELEKKGQLDEAMTALGTALAADPKNAQALTAMKRVRDTVAVREQERARDTRLSSLVSEGRRLLASGKYEDASSVLNQALSIKPTPEVRDLLDESQKQLRVQIEATRNSQARAAMVSTGLKEAAQLETDARIEDALAKLQTVLAIEPQNKEAIDLQARLVKAQAMLASRKSTLEQVARLLEEGQSLFQSGDYSSAATAFSKAIALDPGNMEARSRVTEAFMAINKTLLASGAAPIAAAIPPWIDLHNSPRSQRKGAIQTTETATGTADPMLEQRVSSPEVEISGMVIDDKPRVTLTIYKVLRSPGGLSEKEALSKRFEGGEKMQNGYSFRFAETLPLDTEVTSFKARATDADNLRYDAPIYYSNPDGSLMYGPDGLPVSEGAILLVHYVRPPYRSPWFLSAILLIAVGVPAAYRGYRIHRRNALLKRRFNPYVAGAPVLADDMFLGREVLLSRILATIHNNSILLYGERRIGKTSLQHHLKKRLQALNDPEYEFYPVFIDLQGTPQERFFATLGEDIYTELSPLLDGARPGSGLKEGAAYDYQALVRDLRDVLKKLRERSSRKAKLVLLIDEVDELNAYDPQVNQKLRSLFMKSFAEDLVAVVSGVGIKKHWASEGSPWYNFFEEIEVQPFTRKDAQELIEKPIRGVFELEAGAVDRIIGKTDCKPYRIQKLCVALVSRLHEENRRRITVADVDAIQQPIEG